MDMYLAHNTCSSGLMALCTPQTSKVVGGKHFQFQHELRQNCNKQNCHKQHVTGNFSSEEQEAMVFSPGRARIACVLHNEVDWVGKIGVSKDFL